MSTKNGLLALLEKSRGQVVSGQAAADSLGVSRAAVWKAATALRGLGYPLQSLPGGGYCLPAESDILSAEAVQAHWQDAVYPVQVFDETDSTNLALKRWALEDAPHGAMVLAVRQSAGRGRLGRSFESPPGGLYMSILLRPGRQGFTAAGLVTSAAAVAACQAVQQLCGLSLSIKWVNDLYLDGKKCCGILTEGGTSVESGQIEYLVVGIGINYTTPEKAFTAAGMGVATSLFAGGTSPVPRAALAAGIHTRLLALFGALPDTSFLQHYRAHSLVLGKQVQVLANPPYSALAVGIDDEARLLVETPDGRRHCLSYGEISVQL